MRERISPGRNSPRARGCEGDAELAGDDSGEVADAGCLAGAGVDGEAIELVGGGDEEVGAGNVFDKAEVAGLAAVLIHNGGLAGEQAGAKDSDDAGVGVEERLAGAVGAGITEGDGGDADLFAPEEDEALLVELGEAVDGFAAARGGFGGGDGGGREGAEGAMDGEVAGAELIRGAEAGGGTSQGGPIFAVAQIDTLRILVAVPEGYATSVHPGMAAKVFLQERPNVPFDGTVARLANSLDQNTRTMLTEVDVDNRNHTLYPGMYAVVEFQQLRGTAPLTVPGDAVIVRNDQTSVATVVDGNKVQLRPVQIGRDYGPSVEIVSGLRPGDTVITSVTDGVQQGATVEPRLNKIAGEQATGNVPQPQTAKEPDAGPNQYGDQSIVNQTSEGTNNQGKKGQANGTAHQGQNAKGSGTAVEAKRERQLRWTASCVCCAGEWRVHACTAGDAACAAALYGACACRCGTGSERAAAAAALHRTPTADAGGTREPRAATGTTAAAARGVAGWIAGCAATAA